MKQLHIHEPWATLGFESQQQVLNDLIVRIQMVETRLRQLEAIVARQVKEEETEPVVVGG